METEILLEKINKSFGSVRALEEVTLCIEKGLTTAIVGDNGSGKSTLIKILSGNLRPDSGSITAGGRRWSRLGIAQALRLGIRTVYQDLSLDNCKNSYENVFLGCELMRGCFLDRAAMRWETEALLRRLEIHIPDLELPVRFLSGGQRQGLAIARALRTPGSVLLLDEPTAAMGIRESHQTLELLKRLRAEGVTQVLVSHNIFQVFDAADRIYVMRSGKMVADVMTKSSSPEQLHALILAQENREVAG